MKYNVIKTKGLLCEILLSEIFEYDYEKNKLYLYDNVATGFYEENNYILRGGIHFMIEDYHDRMDKKNTIGYNNINNEIFMHKLKQNHKYITFDDKLKYNHNNGSKFKSLNFNINVNDMFEHCAKINMFSEFIDTELNISDKLKKEYEWLFDSQDLGLL